MDRITNEPLASRLEWMEHEMAAMRRRLRVMVSLCLLGLIIAVLFAPGSGKSIAQQTGGLPALERRVAALEAMTNSQQTAINTLTAQLNAEIAARKQGDADTLAAAKLY